MPRIRTIKPDFFKSTAVSPLPFRTRLTWVGLWTDADDHGRTKDNLKLIKAAVWPLDDDVTIDDIAEDLELLAEHGRIVRYEVGGQPYLAIRNWHSHQKISHKSGPKYPAPPVPLGPLDPDDTDYCKDCAAPNPVGSQREPSGSPLEVSVYTVTRVTAGQSTYPPATGTLPEPSGSPPVVLPEPSRLERKGKEGKGKEVGATQLGGCVQVGNARETAPTPIPSSPVPPKAPIPDDWLPDTEHAQLAAHWGLDLDDQVFRFTNHAKDQARISADWDAAFRGWLHSSWRTFRDRDDRRALSGTQKAVDWLECGLPAPEKPRLRAITGGAS